jgi:hypothetical protein
LAALASKVDSFGTFLSDISAKLDQQRTRRPDMAGLAAMISLVFVIGGLAFAPLYQWVGRLQEQQDKILQVQWERTGTVAEFAADRDHLQEQIENIRAELKVAELKLLGNGNG